MAKRKKKQKRIRAVDDDDDRPQQTNKKPNKFKKKQSNFAIDLTDTSKSTAKRLRYDANQAQKGKFQNGRFRGPNEKKGQIGKDGKGKGQKGKTGKTFGKPKAPKAGSRKKK